MDLALSDEQRMIRDAAAEVLAARSASAQVRAAIDAGGSDDALWHTLARELGWCALAVPEQAGGIGLGATEVVLLMEQMGRRLACVPYFATACLAAPALSQCLDDNEVALGWLERIAAGEVRATLALDTPLDPSATSLRAQRLADGDYRLDGTLDAVIDGASADLLMVAARIEEDIALFAIEATTLTTERTPLATLDATRPLARIVLDGVTVRRQACLATGARAHHALAHAAWFATLALAAEQLGAAQQCLDLTLDYTAGRVQFGRTIASFQAVKHRCAQMLVEIEATRSAVLGAARAWDETQSDDSRADIAVAKATANDALRFCAQEAIQLHGGVGFTWEYDPQLYFKRAQAAYASFGTTPALYAWLAARVIGRNAEPVLEGTPS